MAVVLLILILMAMVLLIVMMAALILPGRLHQAPAAVEFLMRTPMAMVPWTASISVLTTTSRLTRVFVAVRQKILTAIMTARQIVTTTVITMLRS